MTNNHSSAKQCSSLMIFFIKMVVMALQPASVAASPSDYAVPLSMSKAVKRKHSFDCQYLQDI